MNSMKILVTGASGFIGTYVSKIITEKSSYFFIGKKIEFSIPAGIGNKADTDHQFDLTRIRSVLGWQPEYSLTDSLRQTIISFS